MYSYTRERHKMNGIFFLSPEISTEILFCGAVLKRKPVCTTYMSIKLNTFGLGRKHVTRQPAAKCILRVAIHFARFCSNALCRSPDGFSTATKLPCKTIRGVTVLSQRSAKCKFTVESQQRVKKICHDRTVINVTKSTCESLTQNGLSVKKKTKTKKNRIHALRNNAIFPPNHFVQKKALFLETK